METKTYIDYLYSIRKGLFTRPFFVFHAENANLFMNKIKEVLYFEQENKIVIQYYW